MFAYESAAYVEVMEASYTGVERHGGTNNKSQLRNPLGRETPTVTRP